MSCIADVHEVLEAIDKMQVFQSSDVKFACASLCQKLSQCDIILQSGAIFTRHRVV